MKRLDYMLDKSIELYQDDTMFKINSDTINLAKFIVLKKRDYTLLDVGTNNGALILACNKLNKGKHYYGVDINKEALEIAKENMELNKINNVTLVHSKFENLKCEQVDYIVCNPPYFDGDNVSDIENKTKARFAIYLPLENLIKNSKRLLKERGSLFMVYPSFKLPQVIATLDKYGFGVTRLQFVHDENKDESSVFLVEARKGMKHYSKVSFPLINKRSNG